MRREADGVGRQAAGQVHHLSLARVRMSVSPLRVSPLRAMWRGQGGQASVRGPVLHNKSHDLHPSDTLLARIYFEMRRFSATLIPVHRPVRARSRVGLHWRGRHLPGASDLGLRCRSSWQLQVRVGQLDVSYGRLVAPGIASASLFTASVRGKQ